MEVNVGRDITLDVDVDRLSTDVMKHVVYIGLRNILMDAHATATKKNGATVAEAKAMSEKKLDAMYRGEVRTVSTRSGDPVAREVKRMAEETVKAAVVAKYGKVGDRDITAAVKAYIEKNRATLEPKARAAVEDRAALAESVEIDL